MQGNDATRDQSSSSSGEGYQEQAQWTSFRALTAVCSTAKDALESASSQSMDLLSQVAFLRSFDASLRTPTHPPVPLIPQPHTPRALSATSSPIPTPAPRTPSPPRVVREPHIARGTPSSTEFVESLRWCSMHPELLWSVEPRRSSRLSKPAAVTTKAPVVTKDVIRANKKAVALRNARNFKKKLDEAQAALELYARSLGALCHDIEETQDDGQSSSTTLVSVPSPEPQRRFNIKRKWCGSEMEEESPCAKKVKVVSDPLWAGRDVTWTIRAGVNAKGKLALYLGPTNSRDAHACKSPW